MGLYISLEDVRVRLIGKVRFTTDENDENRMHESLANRLINEAEGHVEYDLSPRYAAPFQTDAGGAFTGLPARPTKETVRTLCEVQAVIRILETDFGRGTVVEADKYVEKLQKRYDGMVERVMKKKTDGGQEAQGWMYPPLPGLRLNYMNTEADDGYMGMVLSTSQGDGDYPRAQINDPSENFWNGTLDTIDQDGRR